MRRGAPTANSEIDSLNALFYSPIDLKGQMYQVDLSNNDNNNTLLFGPHSNSQIKLGNGNNIVLNSPFMTSQAISIYEKGGYNRGLGFDALNYFLYPSMQGIKGSNKLSLGDGNNVIYYDSSYGQVKTGKGNNIFAPSFGSFNWATNNSFPIDEIVKSADLLDSYKHDWQVSNNFWFTPIPQQAASRKAEFNQDYNADDLYAMFVDMANVMWPSSKYTYIKIFKGQNFGSPNNPLDSSNTVIAALAPTIGGVNLIGGNGNDTFYGVDPKFYSYDKIADRGTAGEEFRTVFRIAEGDTKTERFSYQNFETIKMMGGRGNNIFNLGDPTNIQPDGLQFKGQYTYQIATSHTSLATESQQKILAYGNIEIGLNQVNVNLSTNVAFYTNTAQTFDPGAGLDTSSLNLANSFATVIDSLSKIGGAFKFLGPVATAIDLTQSVINITKWIYGDPQPIKVETSVLTQPLASWKHAIAINDWNPGTVLNIAVDPTLTTAPNTARWNNIQFLVGNPNKSSDAVYGVSVSSQQGSETEKLLFRLDGLGSPLYGYQSFNFLTQKYQQIDQNNLAFFGTTAIGVKDINSLQNYTAANGFVFSSSDPKSPSYSAEGSHLFYWNDVNNSTIDINVARLSARSISIEFDSRSLGWSWDPKFTSTLDAAAKNVTVDELKKSLSLDMQNSKLWVETDNGWKYYTFAQFDTSVEAYRSALLAKTYYQVNGSKTLISDEQQLVNDLVGSLAKLQKVAPDISKIQQATSASKLTSLSQVTYVEDATVSGQVGVNVFYKLIPEDTSVLKVFVYPGEAATPNKSLDESASAKLLNAAISKALEKQLFSTPPTVVDKATLLAMETATRIDIDCNNIVGLSVRDILGLGLQDLSTNLVTKAYEVVLERSPDSEGFRAWTSALKSGMDIGSILEGFICSAEALDQCGSNGDFVDNLYGLLFDRLPDKAGREAWINKLDSDGRFDEVVHRFVSSEEFVNLIGSYANRQQAINS